MRHHLVPILSILAAAGVVPATLHAEALILKDDTFTMNLGVDIQARQEIWNGKDTTGNDFDGVQGRDGKSNPVFDERRARFMVFGTFDTDFNYYFGILNDKVDNTGYNNQLNPAGTAPGGRVTQIFKAYVERNFHDDDMTHTLHAGIDYPFFNIAIQGDPKWLFPNQRATGTLMGVRGDGLRYKFANPMVTFGVDIMEPLDPNKPAANAAETDGLFYSGRLEVSCLGGPKPSYQESYNGKPGHSLIVAADVGYDSKNFAVAAVQNKVLGYGAEAVFHWDGLSALAEFRALKTESDPGVTIDSRIFLVQAGYAFPVGDGMFLEPAIRYSKIDYNTGVTEVVNYSGGGAFVPPVLTGGPGGQDAENGLSGNQIDIGVNWYVKGHNVQMQLAYSHWTAESGDGKQDVIRLQEQIWF